MAKTSSGDSFQASITRARVASAQTLAVYLQLESSTATLTTAELEEVWRRMGSGGLADLAETASDYIAAAEAILRVRDRIAAKIPKALNQRSGT